MRLKRNRRCLLVLTLLSALIVVYEISLTWQDYPLASIRIGHVYQLGSYSSNDHNGRAFPQHGRNLRKLLEDREIKELPIQISTDCSVDQLHQSLKGNDIICINESRLWSDVTRRGVKINQFSDLQAKTAIVSAVLEELKSRQSKAAGRDLAQPLNRARRDKLVRQYSPNVNAQLGSRDTLNAQQHNITQTEHAPSFYEHMVASFVKESKHKPSDFAIPKLDAFYESHLPPQKPLQDNNGEDGLFPSNVKRKKRPFMPVVVNGNELQGDWGNPLVDEWKHSNIPGIPPMPDRPPSMPGFDSGADGVGMPPNIPGMPPDMPKVPPVPGVPPGMPKMPKEPPDFPEMPGQMPNMPPDMPEIHMPPKYPMHNANELQQHPNLPSHSQVYSDKSSQSHQSRYQSSYVEQHPYQKSQPYQNQYQRPSVQKGTSSVSSETKSKAMSSSLNIYNNLKRQVESAVSGTNSTKLSAHAKANSGVISLGEDLLQLRSFKFRENFDLITRKLPTRFKYDGIRIKDRLKYVEKAVNSTDPVLRDIVQYSLNPDILERAKVSVCVCVCVCMCMCVR